MKREKERRETLLHKIITTAVSAAVMAVVAGMIGYKLNSNLPDLYYEVTPVEKVGKLYFRDINVHNLGRGPATQLVIRYSFNCKIASFDYNYSEGLKGKLPPGSSEGGRGSEELLLTAPRLLPKDVVKASFIFNDPDVTCEVKVFSKEVMGRPYDEWKEKVTSWEKFAHGFGVWINSVWYNLQKPNLKIPVIKVQNLIKKYNPK